jgi:4-amino-4-deoxy-L-arabinose transferase-like glycosyltransferase
VSRLRIAALVFLPAFLQLLVFWSFDLGVDEAHYMLYARHLDLSYFDHPPLVGWVHFLFNSVFGENLFSARLPAILAGAFSSWQLFRFLGEQGFSERASAWGTFAFGLCFQFFVLNLFLLPDTLCLALIWPLLRASVRVGERPSLMAWLRLGFWLGLMGLSKYTAVFFLVPVAAVILPRQGFSFWKDKGFYAAILLALLVISPVLQWNQQRDWLSFRYQGAHVLGGEHGLRSFFQSLAAQFALYSPFLWPFSLIGFRDLFRRQRDEARFAFWTAAVVGVFFLFSSWQSTVLPHWPSLFYLFTIPWGVALVFEKREKIAKAAALATAALVGALCFLLVTGLGYGIPGALKEVGGWPSFLGEVKTRLQSDRDGVGFLNWTYGSRALYYGRDFENRIFILDDRFDQFDLWNSNPVQGRDLWIVQFSYDERELGDIVRCSSLGEKEKIPVSVRGFYLYDVLLQKCSMAEPLR